MGAPERCGGLDARFLLLRCCHSCILSQSDYWEVYDSNLANHLFRKYGKEIEALRIKLDIAPGPGEPFQRTSLVTRARPGSSPIIP